MTYLFACENMSAKLDLAEGALTEGLAEHVVANCVALLLVVGLGRSIVGSHLNLNSIIIQT